MHQCLIVSHFVTSCPIHMYERIYTCTNICVVNIILYLLPRLLLTGALNAPVDVG